MMREYRTPAAFKQALEQRLRTASTSGIDFALLRSTTSHGVGNAVATRLRTLMFPLRMQGCLRNQAEAALLDAIRAPGL